MAVVGSLDPDLVVPVPRHPVTGGTVLARHPGGKGAHQAVAAARLGGDVALVGDDDAAGVTPDAVRPVDTAADGGSFHGALAVAPAEGRTLGQSARGARSAAAIGTTRAGAQPSLARREEVEAFLARQR
ncbi:hypothetical protein [Streptomyces fungicidicus]